MCCSTNLDLDILADPGKTKKDFNPFLTGGFVQPYHLDESISTYRGFW